MMRKLNIIILGFLITTCLVAEIKKDSIQIKPTNNIYLNILGEVSLYSINYEHLFILDSKFFIATKFGVGYSKEYVLLNFSGYPVREFLTLPHHITFNYGKGKSFLEFGLGGTFLTNNGDRLYYFYPILGLRYQPLKSGKIIFRIYTSYSISSNTKYQFFIPPIGISFGLAI